MKQLVNILFIITLCISGYIVEAQDTALKSLRVTGVVMDSEDKSSLPYVNILITGTQYGTSTDNNGYFSIFINPGDTLEFSYIGYKKAVFIMPYNPSGSNYSLMQIMNKETLVLSEVVVFPWPTIENFQKAFLDTKPKKNQEDFIFEVQRKVRKVAKDNLKSEYYYEQMQYNRLYELHGQVPPNNFLNPMRWTNFLTEVLSKDK